MAGMFDSLTQVPQTPSTRAPEGGAIQGATPEQIKAAVERLRAKKLPVNKVSVAEEIATGDTGEAEQQAAPRKVAAPQGEPMRPRPVMGGAQPSPEMMANIKAQQEARNRAILERAMAERRRMSGAR